MDWGLLNAIGITLMAVFGMWVFHRAHAGLKDHRRKPGEDRK